MRSGAGAGSGVVGSARWESRERNGLPCGISITSRSASLRIRNVKQVVGGGELHKGGGAGSVRRPARFVTGTSQWNGCVSLHVNDICRGAVVWDKGELFLPSAVKEERGRLPVRYWERTTRGSRVILLLRLEVRKVNDENECVSRRGSWHIKEVDVILSQSHDRIVVGD